jgi:PAS domain-containing protein
MVLEGTVNLLTNPLVLRTGLLLFAGITAFGLCLFLMRQLRKNLVTDSASASLLSVPSSTEGLPVHAYHSVIQQLKQQKHELAAQHLSERRKAKASDTLSSAILANLSCGVLFLNNAGLVRQANSAARDILGFASPVGLHSSDLFRNATLRSENETERPEETLDQILAPALTGKATVRGRVNYRTRDGENHVLEMTGSPVVAEDASLMGTTLVLTDTTELERLRHHHKAHHEISAELASRLRTSLTTITGSVQQLVRSSDPAIARQLADGIAREAEQLDRTIGSFLGDAKAATTNS